MRNETWMSAADAVSRGFADTVTKTKKAANAALETSIHAALPGARAASGALRSGVVRLSLSPGASGPQSNSRSWSNVKTAEAITAYENKRAASVARMSALMEVANDAGTTLDETQSHEYDGLDTEVKTIDGHLVRLRAHEARIVADASRIDLRQVDNPAAGSDARSGGQAGEMGRGNLHNGVSIRANVEKGIPFVRYVKALVSAKGIPESALNAGSGQSEMDGRDPRSRSGSRWPPWPPVTPRPPAGRQNWSTTRTSPRRSLSICARRPSSVASTTSRGCRSTYAGTQTSGSTGYWVGQGSPIPVSNSELVSLLPWHRQGRRIGGPGQGTDLRVPAPPPNFWFAMTWLRPLSSSWT